MAMISICKMALQDLEAVHRISVRSFSSPWSLAAIQEEFNHELTYYLTARDQTKTVGFIGAWLVMDEVQITNIAVDPGHRRRGIARQLLKQLIDDMRSKSMAVIYLEVRVSNAFALDLYTSFGFITTGLRKGFYPDGEDALTMSLDLKSETAATKHAHGTENW